MSETVDKNAPVEETQSAAAGICRYFDACGACPWHDIDIAGQRDRKREALVELLGTLNGVADAPSLVRPCVDCGTWRCDNKLKFQMFGYHKLFKMGFYQQADHKPLPVDTCIRASEQVDLLPAALEKTFHYLEQRGRLDVKEVTTRYSDTTNDLEIALWTRPGHFPDEVVTGVIDGMAKPSSLVRVHFRGELDDPQIARISVMQGDGVWRDEIAGETLAVSAPSFYPENSAGAAQLVELVSEALDPSDAVTVVNAGVGLFVLPLARAGHDVVAAETFPTAHADLLRNLETSELADKVAVNVLADGDQDASAPALPEGPLDALVIDSQGCTLDEATIRAAVAANPSKVVLVSYDLDSTAAAITALTENGSLAVSSITPVDLYPQTERIASVSVLVRK